MGLLCASYCAGFSVPYCVDMGFDIGFNDPGLLSGSDGPCSVIQRLTLRPPLSAPADGRAVVSSP